MTAPVNTPIPEWRPGDLRYTHDQADAWHAIVDALGPMLTKRLAPACSQCAAPEELLHWLPASCEFSCERCGGRSSTIPLTHGRIVSA